MGVTIKTPEEMIKMRTACRLAAELLDMITSHVKAGITTDELDDICHRHITDSQQAVAGCLNYKGFPKSVCTSVNHVVCHGVPGKKMLKDGDIINIDVLVKKDGYFGDTSRMFMVGEPSVLAQRLCKVTYECLIKAIHLVKPGARLGDIGYCIQSHAQSNRFSVVRDFCGHGVGANIHEDPQVLHFGKPNTGMKLREGMTFTIEPILNAGKSAIRILPDGWTAVTKDHSLSAQWEHTIAVTADGYEVLTLAQGEKI